MKRILLVLLSILILIAALLAIAVFVPFPLDPYLDFQVLYRADSGILQGISLYDLAGQKQMVAEELGVSVERVHVLPFPYPPWYAVITLPLALLPIEIAVRMWLLLNIAMLLLSVWLLTDGWPPRKRLYSFLAAFLFFPVFGALVVGQYVFPTVLGIALVIYALKHQHAGLTALGMALVTFKPHIGIFILLAMLIYFLSRRDDFGRRAFLATAFAGILLFIIGFIADRAWPITYLQSLVSFKDTSECQLCVSMPLTIAQMIGLGFNQSAFVAVILLAGLIGLLIRSRHRLGDEASVAYVVCVALLVSPYLQNYDFAFALIPLFFLLGSATSKMDWLWVTLIFMLPILGPGLFGRAGNSTLLISTLMTTVIILTRFYKEHTITS